MSGPPSYPDFCQPGALSHLASAYTVPSNGHPAVFGSQAPQPEPQFSYAQPDTRANSLLAELTLVDAQKLTAAQTPHSYHGRSRMILSGLCKPSKTLLEAVEKHGLFLSGSDTTQHLARSLSLMRDLVERPPSSASAFCESFMACAAEICQVQVDLQLHQQTRIQEKTEALHTVLRNISRDLEPVQAALRRATWAPPETQTHMTASGLTAYLHDLKEQCGLPDPIQSRDTTTASSSRAGRGLGGWRSPEWISRESSTRRKRHV